MEKLRFPTEQGDSLANGCPCTACAACAVCVVCAICAVCASCLAPCVASLGIATAPAAIGITSIATGASTGAAAAASTGAATGIAVSSTKK